jgi:hypothetical protein
MGLKVHLLSVIDSTDPSLFPGGVCTLSLDCQFFKDNVIFPPVGVSKSLNFPTVPSSAFFELNATIVSGNDSLGFRYSDIGGEDTLFLSSINSTRFLSSVSHRQIVTRFAPCIARCADGKSAPGCVECTSGKVTAKICC